MDPAEVVIEYSEQDGRLLCTVDGFLLRCPFCREPLAHFDSEAGMVASCECAGWLRFKAERSGIYERLMEIFRKVYHAGNPNKVT